MTLEKLLEAKDIRLAEPSKEIVWDIVSYGEEYDDLELGWAYAMYYRLSDEERLKYLQENATTESDLELEPTSTETFHLSDLNLSDAELVRVIECSHGQHITISLEGDKYVWFDGECLHTGNTEDAIDTYDQSSDWFKDVLKKHFPVDCIAEKLIEIAKLVIECDIRYRDGK